MPLAFEPFEQLDELVHLAAVEHEELLVGEDDLLPDSDRVEGRRQRLESGQDFAVREGHESLVGVRVLAREKPRPRADSLRVDEDELPDQPDGAILALGDVREREEVSPDERVGARGRAREAESLEEPVAGEEANASHEAEPENRLPELQSPGAQPLISLDSDSSRVGLFRHELSDKRVGDFLVLRVKHNASTGSDSPISAPNAGS